MKTIAKFYHPIDIHLILTVRGRGVSRGSFLMKGFPSTS